MPILNLESPVFISVDGAGRANAGGTIGVYVAGTSFATPVTIWSDQVKTSELTNPVTLDSAGTKEIWYDVKVDIRETFANGSGKRDTLNIDPNAAATAQTGFNLATNGSFETDTDSDGLPDSWTISAYSGSDIAITGDVVTDGVKALEFNTAGAATGGGTATSSKFAVTEGSVCSVAWSFYATHATTTNTFQIKWYDEDDVLQSTSTLAMPASGAVPTSWTNYTEEVTVPAGGTQGEIVLIGIASGGANLTSKAYFDGIKVVNLENMVTLAGVQTLTNKILTSPVLNTQATGTAIKDEDDMVSDSDTHLVTQQSIKAFVESGGAVTFDAGITKSSAFSSTLISNGNSYTVPAGVWNLGLQAAVANVSLQIEIASGVWVRASDDLTTTRAINVTSDGGSVAVANASGSDQTLYLKKLYD